MGNNPVTQVDPDGAWHKDADGNLVSDTGDTVKSLADYKRISLPEADRIFIDQGFLAKFFGMGSGHSRPSSFKGGKNIIDYTNNINKYTYSSKDLEIRSALMNSRVLSEAILNMESVGVFALMAVDDWASYYGADYYNSFRFFSGFEIGFPFAGGASFTPAFRSTPNYRVRLYPNNGVRVRVKSFKVHGQGRLKSIPNKYGGGRWNRISN